jgi:hypothetical protein
MRLLSLVVGLATSFGALAAPPVPDPRLEQAVSTNLIAQIERSVQFERTLPQPAKLAKPAVDPGEMAKVADDVYVDRRLVPQDRVPDNENAIRIFRRDSPR